MSGRDDHTRTVDVLAGGLSSVRWDAFVGCDAREWTAPGRLVDLFRNQMHGARLHYRTAPWPYVTVAETAPTTGRPHLHALVHLPPEFDDTSDNVRAGLLREQRDRWTRKHGRSVWRRYNPSRGGARYVADKWSDDGTVVRASRAALAELADAGHGDAARMLTAATDAN